MRSGHKEVVVPPRPPGEQEVIIEAHDLTQRFGDFVAVDHVSMRIERGRSSASSAPTAAANRRR